MIKGVVGAPIKGVTLSNISLKMGKPARQLVFVFDCEGDFMPLAIDGLDIDWGAYKDEWSGLQSNTSCLKLNR